MTVEAYSGSVRAVDFPLTPRIQRLMDRLTRPDLLDPAGGQQAAEHDGDRPRADRLLQDLLIPAVDLSGDGPRAEGLSGWLASHDAGDQAAHPRTRAEGGDRSLRRRRGRRGRQGYFRGGLCSRLERLEPLEHLLELGVVKSELLAMMGLLLGMKGPPLAQMGDPRLQVVQHLRHGKGFAHRRLLKMPRIAPRISSSTSLSRHLAPESRHCPKPPRLRRERKPSVRSESRHYHGIPFSPTPQRAVQSSRRGIPSFQRFLGGAKCPDIDPSHVIRESYWCDVGAYRIEKAPCQDIRRGERRDLDSIRIILSASWGISPAERGIFPSYRAIPSASRIIISGECTVRSC